MSWILSCRFSLEGGQLGCSEERLLERSWHQREVCSVLRRCELPIEDGEEWFLISCCLEQHCPPIPRFRRTSTPRQQQGRREHQRQHAQHSFPCEEDGGFYRREIAAPLEKNGFWILCPWLCLYRDQTWRTSVTSFAIRRVIELVTNDSTFHGNVLFMVLNRIQMHQSDSVFYHKINQ